MYENINKNSQENIKRFMDDKSFKKFFVITGKNSYFKSGANKIFDKILLNKSSFFYFKKSYYPEVNELKSIIASINRFNPDLLIAVGGGSVLDYSKIARVLNLSIDLNNQIINSSYKIVKKKYKLLAIPTTAGSGAEVTASAVIYINKKKYSVENEKLKPDYFFLVPGLIIKGSKKIKASAGFDAISQAIESLISIKSNSRSVNFAKKSLNISLKYFVNYVNRPTIDNTFKMALAANLSGKAISISKTTAPHALSYPFTAYFKISHGHAVSLTLNECLNFNYNNINQARSEFSLKDRFNIIFKLAKVKNIAELEKYLTNIKKKTGLEINFKRLGINIDKDCNKILSGVNSQRLKNNPVPLETRDLYSILINK